MRQERRDCTEKPLFLPLEGLVVSSFVPRVRRERLRAPRPAASQTRERALIQPSRGEARVKTRTSLPRAIPRLRNKSTDVLPFRETVGSHGSVAKRVSLLSTKAYAFCPVLISEKVRKRSNRRPTGEASQRARAYRACKCVCRVLVSCTTQCLKKDTRLVSFHTSYC